MKKKEKNLIISILAGLAFISALVLYQKWAISKEINLTQVVYATAEIPPRTKITEDMVTKYEVPGSSIPPNAETDLSKVVGKYTADGFGITQNSMVYKERLVNKEELPDAGVLDLKNSEAAFPLLVDIETSLGNSIMPKTHVDLYFRTSEKGMDKNGNQYEKPVFGKIASNVRVTAAKDSQAGNVFSESDTTNQSDQQGQSATSQSEKQRELTKLYIFAVSQDQNILLNKAKMIGEIVPVATGESYQGEKEHHNEKSEQELKEWIEKRSEQGGEK